MKWDPEGDPGQWDGVELDADDQVAMLHMEIKSSEINSSEGDIHVEGAEDHASHFSNVLLHVTIQTCEYSV